MRVIGVDMGGTNVRAALVEDNKVLKTVSDKINRDGSMQEVIDNITDSIDKVWTRDVKGIGIGVPAIVDVEKEIVYEVLNIKSWHKVELKKILEKKYGCRVIVNNDANCFALGEKYFGAGKKYDNVVGLILGTGVGAGIIINGKLYSGRNCGAGEFGEIIYKDNVIAHYSSAQFLEREGIRKVKIDKDPVFILGDHRGLPAKELKRLKKLCTPITIGPATYFASQTIAVVNNELDRREVEGSL